ncbi:conserved hypothetical protein [Sporisorium reilianum SRZ2]|uniref:UBA domain-containing protein n=1 Tax=Sporisorium reilianum (strain SRZ2) TaxID=999809 RepID=E6ZQC6_SPORE|nr:conserved hypothetical protein [Sporisorium reilianum SRZ2]
MADRPSLIQQVSSITGCNDYQAETVLERSNWDVERAMNSYFDDPPPERPTASSNAQSSSTAVVPFQASDPTSGWDVPNNPTYAPPPGQPPASSRNWSTDNKDFTNDADTDDDLRRAMAASLQDHQSQQTYRPPAPSSTVGDIGMSEDEQLRQALEASVQSHHDLLQSTGSGARTPALPQHLDTDLQSRRAPGAPVAMVAPFTSLEVVAALLQALFAAPPVRKAYLASRAVDTRGSDLSNYWKGAPPTDAGSDPAAQPTLDAHLDLARRIQTLFAFATLSQRPLCVAKDVTSLSPNEVVARGADRSPADKVAALFYEFVVDSYTKHIAALSSTMLKTDGAEPVETDALWMNYALFLSSGAAALTSPASPRINGTPADAQVHAVAPPKVEQQRSLIQLRHDSVNSDTYSCLRAALASDGDGALLTRTASVISMGVDHAIPTAEGGPPPFTINERIYLDSLMWDRRQGVRLDAELHDDEMRRLDTMRQELEARKRKLAGDGGRLSSEVLLGAKRYFEQVATPADGADAIRAASLAEAGPQISKILEALQADLAATDQLIAKIRAQIDAKRALVAERAKREASNPQWTQLAYDLCAVLYTEAGSCVSLVKQHSSGTWWRISAGRAVQVDVEDVVMGRAQDPSLGVFWVVYARAEEGAAESSAQESEAEVEALISEAIKAAIADDNLTYESELLSLIRSDAVTPSSSATDANAGEQAPQQPVEARDDDQMVITSGRISPHTTTM